MVAKLVDCEVKKLTFVCDLSHDVHVIELRPQLDDGIKDGEDGSCIKSLRVGGVSGGTWCTIYDNLPPFEDILGGMSIHGL